MNYLIFIIEGNDEVEFPKIVLDLASLGGKTFQNLKVSSPAPVTIVCPSGLKDKYKTL